MTTECTKGELDRLLQIRDTVKQNAAAFTYRLKPGRDFHVELYLEYCERRRYDNLGEEAAIGRHERASVTIDLPV